MLAEPTPNQSNGASWRRELAPEPGVEGTWPEPRVPGEVGDPEALGSCRGGAGRPLGSSSTHTYRRGSMRFIIHNV